MKPCFLPLNSQHPVLKRVNGAVCAAGGDTRFISHRLWGGACAGPGPRRSTSASCLLSWGTPAAGARPRTRGLSLGPGGELSPAGALGLRSWRTAIRTRLLSSCPHASRGARAGRVRAAHSPVQEALALVILKLQLQGPLGVLSLLTPCSRRQ